MTDPGSAIKRQLDDLIQLQVSTLKRSGPLTSRELVEYHERSTEISKLFEELAITRSVGGTVSIQRFDPTSEN